MDAGSTCGCASHVVRYTRDSCGVRTRVSCRRKTDQFRHVFWRYTRAALAARRAESRSTGLGYERIERVVLDCDGLRLYTPGMPLADSDVLLDVVNLQRVTAGLRSVELIRTGPSTPCLVVAAGAPYSHGQIVGVIAPHSLPGK